MANTVIGVFSNRAEAESAIKHFEVDGFNPKDISIVMSDSHEGEEIESNTGAHVAEGAVSGATTGAVVGGIAGLLAASALPALGGFLIGGPIGAALGLTGAAASTVSGAATGVVAGGLIGALAGLGVPSDKAKVYEQKVKEGGILVAVPVRDDEAEKVVSVMDQYHASDVLEVE